MFVFLLHLLLEKLKPPDIAALAVASAHRPPFHHVPFSTPRLSSKHIQQISFLFCFCGIFLTFYQLFSAPTCLFSVVANQVNHNKTPLGPPRHMPVLTYIQTLIHSRNQLFMYDFPDKNIVFPSVQQTMRYRYCWYLSHTPTSYG